MQRQIERVFASHRLQRLIWKVTAVPSENAAPRQEKPFAGLWRQAADATQMIQIGDKQWRVGIWHRIWS
jgi:hypothetical protein